MKRLRTASWAATFFALAASLAVNAQDTTCGKNHYILDYAVTPWTTTGNLNVARGAHTATLLPDGRVLVAGGRSISNMGVPVALDSAEIYDPATKIWTVTGSLTKPRVWPTATLLPNGRVLVVGGDWSFGTAELYDPATGTWTPTGSLNTPRDGFTATLLATGQVLVAGGVDNSDATLNSAELYDPSTETWSFTSNLVTARFFHTATPLADDRILVGAGWTDDFFQTVTSTAELYDPIAGTWSSTARLNEARVFHTATRLPDGKVLIAGGYRHNLIRIPGSPGTFYVPTSLDQAELFDPVTGTWEIVASPNGARQQHTATLLPDGKVLVAGGFDYNARLNVRDTEVYDPTTGTWTNAASLGSARYNHTATLLPDRSVLVVGGDGPEGTLDSAELYAAPSSSGCQ